MKSSDVTSKYYNSRSSPTTKYKLVDVGSSGSCRLFSVVWTPYVVTKNIETGIEIWSGDPDSGGSKIYQDGVAVGAGFGSGEYQGLQKFMNYFEFPSHYILSRDDLWVLGVNSGINNVTITYQLGG